MHRNLFIVLAGLASFALSLFISTASAAETTTSLPEGAKGFAGMIRGNVVSTGTNELVLSVTEVAKVWNQSKASNPQSLVGKQVQVRGQNENMARFIATLKAGDSVGLDVVNKEGDFLTIAELTKEQREKVKQVR